MTQGSSDNRPENATNVASAYIQVLIGLASGIIAAILAFYPTITEIENIDINFLKISLIILGLSLVAGFCSFGTLIDAIEEGTDKIPTASNAVKVTVICQIILFGVGLAILLFIIISLPPQKSQVANVLIEDAIQELQNNNSLKALERLTLADQQLAINEKNQTLKVFVENSIQALGNNDTKKALTFLGIIN